MSDALLNALGRIVRDTLQAGVRSWLREQTAGTRTQTRRRTDAPASDRRGSDYPGDFAGTPAVEYAPLRGDSADPGEVVWTWVPYEEDHSRGKDRPVLLVGRDGPWLLGLQLTSKDHDRDEAQEAREGRYWIDIGSGAWDPQGRPSEVRVNRVVRVDPDAVRRVSVALPRDRFDAVVAALREHGR